MANQWPELQSLVMARINSPEFADVMGLYPGGVWDRLPRPGTGPGSTATAYWPDTDPEDPGGLKNTISVIDGGEAGAPNGAARNGFSGFPLVYAYVTDSPVGRNALAALEARMRLHFARGKVHPVYTLMNDGGGVELLMLPRDPLREGDEFGYTDRIFSVWRIQGTFVRK